MFGILSAHAEELLRRLEQSKSMRGRVESLLMPILHTGNADMDTLAGKLGLSRQTLFRKLKMEGVTFEKVLDELRHTMALHYARVHAHAEALGVKPLRARQVDHVDGEMVEFLDAKGMTALITPRAGQGSTAAVRAR